MRARDSVRIGADLPPHSSCRPPRVARESGPSKSKKLQVVETDRVFPHTYHFEDGYLYPDEEPGLGVDFDEELAAKFPL